MNQNHIANSPCYNRQIHISADPLKTDYQKTCDDFGNTKRVLSKRSLAEAIYDKYCHYGRGQNSSQIMNHFRQWPVTENKKRKSPEYPCYKSCYSYDRYRIYYTIRHLKPPRPQLALEESSAIRNRRSMSVL